MTVTTPSIFDAARMQDALCLDGIVVVLAREMCSDVGHPRSKL